MAGYALGIDLGTTYTAAAVVRDERAEIVPLGNRAATIPTVVFFGEDGTFKVGEAAEPRGISAPARVAREFKRRMGDSTPVVLGGTAWSAEALMGEVLRFVADAVSEREGGPADRVALTHPANWGPYKLDLLTQAVRLAGLKVDRYLSEPEAAAFSYAASASERVPEGAVIAVYDLGGGTFDATVLRTTRSGFDILGNPEGIERLGGIDVDEMVFAHVRSALGDAFTALDPSDPSVLPLMARLRADCVAAKEQLSSDSEVAIPVTLPGSQTEVRLTRAELDAAVRPPLEHSIAALRRAIAGAGVEADDLHAVLLVGGSSRMPIVADLVSDALRRPVAIDAHPKHGVALGAALAAGGAVARSVEQPEPVTVGNVGGALSPVSPASPVTRSLPTGPFVTPSPPPAPVAETPAPAASLVAAPEEPVAGAPSPVVGPSRSDRLWSGSLKTLVGAVGVLSLLVAVLIGVNLGQSGARDPLAVTTPAGAVAPAGTVACPSGSEAVCIDEVGIDSGQLVVDFQPHNTELAAPVDGSFPEETVHPLFFFDTLGPEAGRHWGPTSPFSGTSPAGFEGYSIDDIPPQSNLCVVLIDADGTWIPGTGNCVEMPTVPEDR